MDPREFKFQTSNHLVRGVRYAADITYRMRDDYAPTSPEWRALHALAIRLEERAQVFQDSADAAWRKAE